VAHLGLRTFNPRAPKDPALRPGFGCARFVLIAGNEPTGVNLEEVPVRSLKRREPY
jgi:hypothetical protein